MNENDLIEFLTFTNETLTAAAVIIAATLLLYNLVRNWRDPVTQASSALLACVTIVYGVESVTGLQPSWSSLENWLRMQWIGIAFMPAAMFHLADALLRTTGKPSRGRRRRVVRLMYILSAIFTLLAAFTDTIMTHLVRQPVLYMHPGSLFPVFTLYFIVASFFSMRFVWRARGRCLTRSTRRRMTLLSAVFLTPGLGIFPYSMLFDLFADSQGTPLLPLVVVFNLANLFVVTMLFFMAYPLSYFGSDKPDRLVKAELLQFLLRGPLTAIVLLAVLVTVPRLSIVLGLKREDFLIVATIAILLFMQWSITLLLPLLEKWFIYTKDQQEASSLRHFSERLLTQADRKQYAEAILAAVCDQLRVPTAFLAAVYPDGSAALEHRVGDVPDTIVQELPEDVLRFGEIYRWHSFWLLPLRANHTAEETPLLGVMGVLARESPPELTEDEQDLLNILADRAARLLADMRIQMQLFSTIDELASEIESMRHLNGISRYGQIQREILENTEVFNDWVRGALRDFWGGPKLAESKLINLAVVQGEQEKQKTSPTRALQNILTEAIESLKPEGERSMTTAEWILYNILELRFLQGKKVRDVALQLAMSDADFYRKQKIAIEEVARRISEMERQELETQSEEMPTLQQEQRQV